MGIVIVFPFFFFALNVSMPALSFWYIHNSSPANVLLLCAVRWTHISVITQESGESQLLRDTEDENAAYQ